MAFTSRLGTIDSRLGNIVLGFADIAQVLDVEAENTLVLSQFASIAQRVDQVFTMSQSATFTFQFNKTATNTLTFSQSSEPNAVLNWVADNTISFVDEALKTVPVDAEDDLVLSQDCTVVKLKSGSGNNSIVFSQSCTSESDFNRSVIQTLVLNQTATKTLSISRSVDNVLVFSQSAIGTESKLTSGSLTFSQTAECEYVYGAHNVIELTQSVEREVDYNRDQYSNFIPFQVLSVSSTFRRTLTDTLTITQEVTVQVVRPVFNALNFTQQADAISAKGTYDLLVFLDGANCNFTKNLEVESELIVIHDLQVQKSRAVAADNALGFNQFANGTKQLSATASSTFTLVQDLVRDRTLESVNQSLTFDQDVVGQKLSDRTATSSLILSQTVGISKTVVRAVTSNLIFRNSFQRYVGIGGGTIITVPEIQVVKVQNLVILESNDTVIVLKAPEFNDTEGGTSRLNIKRTMDGTKRIYKRESSTSRLTYDFVMDRKKAIELRSFINGNNSKILKMTNWKGEVWYVNFTNNPFNFTEDARRDSPWGNRSTISLEFEGVRIN